MKWSCFAINDWVNSSSETVNYMQVNLLLAAVYYIDYEINLFSEVVNRLNHVLLQRWFID